jgi:hypothetical protein
MSNRWLRTRCDLEDSNVCEGFTFFDIPKIQGHDLGFREFSISISLPEQNKDGVAVGTNLELLWSWTQRFHDHVLAASQGFRMQTSLSGYFYSGSLTS